MKNNDFKDIHVFNYLISIQLPLKSGLPDLFIFLKSYFLNFAHYKKRRKKMNLLDTGISNVYLVFSTTEIFSFPLLILDKNTIVYPYSDKSLSYSYWSMIMHGFLLISWNGKNLLEVCAEKKRTLKNSISSKYVP